MLTKLDISDFQAHKHLVIDLDPGITTIVGSSDVGKSAILRALRWLATNKPGGEAFIRNGAEETRVKLTVDGHTIARTRGKGNTYHLDGTLLEAFSSSVPDEVTKILNLADINFQAQHDSPFWFSETAGEVSRQLNAIVNLGAIDQVLAWFGTQQRDLAAKERVLTGQLEVAKADRERLKPIKEVDAALAELEAETSRISETLVRRTVLGDLVAAVMECGRRSESALKSLSAAKTVVLAGSAWAELDQKRIQLEILVKSLGELKARASRPVPNLAPLEARYKAWQDGLAARKPLAELVWQLKDLTDTAQVTREEAAELHQRLEKELEGKECPLCGQKIKTTRS